jgi:hypothetical protein
MRVLIYIEDVIGVHYATDLELAARHLAAGDEVHLILCHGSLQSCPANIHHDRTICALCISKLRVGLSSRLMARAMKHVLHLENYVDEKKLPELYTIEGLKNYSIDGVRHGMEAASSVISALRDPQPDMEAQRPMVRRNLVTSVALYRAAMDFLERLQPDLCYVLNGRRSSQMPVVRALREKGIRFSTYEVGHKWNRYIVIEGTYFHDLANKKREIEQYWETGAPLAEKEQIGHSFFHDRRYGSGDDFPEALFKKNQNAGRLPSNFDPAKRNIAIFNSSEDEFAAVDGYDNPVYKDQIEGLRQIVTSPEISRDIRFYLRVHPNLGQVVNFQTRALEDLRSNHLTIIGATENIDTYALMENSEKVLTFGSAMSIESAYAGKPSILIGREPYEDLGACYTPRSHSEAITLINNPNLPPLNRIGALKYGYYMVARDRTYEYYDPGTNTFQGRTLAPSQTVQRLVRIWRAGIFAYLVYRLRLLVKHALKLVPSISSNLQRS